MLEIGAENQTSTSLPNEFWRICGFFANAKPPNRYQYPNLPFQNCEIRMVKNLRSLPVPDPARRRYPQVRVAALRYDSAIEGLINSIFNYVRKLRCSSYPPAQSLFHRPPFL
jgi:hypothetical protein